MEFVKDKRRRVGHNRDEKQRSKHCEGEEGGHVTARLSRCLGTDPTVLRCRTKPS